MSSSECKCSCRSIHAARRKAASVAKKLAAARNKDDENRPCGQGYLCRLVRGLVLSSTAR